MKTSELTGAALDWAVAKCEGVNEEAFNLYYDPVESTDYDKHGFPEFHYSTNWAQGGPIIEREIAKIERFSYSLWEATAFTKNAQDIVQSSPTPLLAAMRCYVASKLGDTVDIPKELTT
jgi:hypothetical protein